MGWFSFEGVGDPVSVPELTYIDTPLGRVALRDTHPRARSRPTVVLVHGWCADSLSNWHQVFAPLADSGWRAIAVDVPGFGRTPLHNRWSVRHAAEVVAAAVTEKKVSDPVLCGFSLGGPITQTARRNGFEASGIVQIATAAHIVPSFMDKGALHLVDRWWGTIGEAATTLRVVDLANRDSAPDSTTLAGHGRWMVRHTNKRAVAQAGGALARYDARPWLAALTPTPAVVAVTTRDRAVPPAAQRELATLLAAHVVDVDAGHTVCVQPGFAATVVGALGLLDEPRET